MEPGAEALRIAQPGEFPPGEEECLLDGVLGPLRIAQDPVGDAVAEVAVEVDQFREGDIVAVPCPFDQPRPHGRYSSGARSGASPTTDGRTAEKVQNEPVSTAAHWPGQPPTAGRARTRSADPGADGARTGGNDVDPTAHHVAMTDTTPLPPVPGFVDLHTRLRAGETLYGAFAGLGSPVATELLARAGFDWLIIDLEHGVGTEGELLANLHAMGATRTAALVRPPSGERLRIGRALDLGAHGIMVPRIDLPEQAREAISFMRYPPDGSRGLALSTRGAGLGALGHTDVQAINRRILGIIQIESPSAVDHAFEIAAIDGVDVLFVGPTDLSHSLGIPGRFDDPAYLAALERVVSVAEGAGKAAGILLRDAKALPRHRELGFRFIGLGSDGAFITDAARVVLAGTST
jgi:2-keto-3-deoxy-L-rhamnonate aldolase RhmA